MFLLNGKKIHDRGFEAGEYRCPPGWIALATPEERAAVGITEVPDPIWPDQRFYTAVENADGSLTVTAKPLAGIKQAKISELKQAREAAAQADVTVAGKVFPADKDYQFLVSSMAARAARGKPLPGELRGVDGTPVALTAALLGQIEDAIVAQVEASWGRFWTRVDAVKAAADVAGVEAVTW